MKKRFVSMLHALAMVSALFVAPVSAAYTYSRDTASRDELSNFFSRGVFDDDLIQGLLEVSGLSPYSSDLSSTLKWWILDWVFANCRSLYGDYGELSYDQLSGVCTQFNNNFRNADNSSAFWYYFSMKYAHDVLTNGLWNGMWIGSPRFSVTYDAGDNIYRRDRLRSYFAWQF